MQLWPFKRRQPEKLSPTELRDRLIDAAAGNKTKLKAACQQYRDQVSANLDFLSRVPEGLGTNEKEIERHVQRLTAVAECLANDCHAPELWELLTEANNSNPLQEWSDWFERVAERKELLEYDALIQEVTTLIQNAATFRGLAARQNLALLHGNLGDLLFNSGRVHESEAAFRTALKLSVDEQDREGQRTYLINLIEVYRHLGDIQAATNAGEELLPLLDEQDGARQRLQGQIELLRQGEPLCRITCRHNGKELELDDISSIGHGHFEFNYRRNRIALQKVRSLVERGKELGAAGKLSEALETFQQAAQIDPHDPDPVYQIAVCLLELGDYGRAHTAFSQVEQLAPGWFHCRSDQWLSQALEEGTVTDKEFRVLRIAQDGGLPADQVISVSHQTLKLHPSFAPLHLVLGDRFREQNDLTTAIVCYRKGLEFVAEPDLESRLLCALASILPKDSPDRAAYLDRILGLKGNLMAQATAVLLKLN